MDSRGRGNDTGSGRRAGTRLGPTEHGSSGVQPLHGPAWRSIGLRSACPAGASSNARSHGLHRSNPPPEPRCPMRTLRPCERSSSGVRPARSATGASPRACLSPARLGSKQAAMARHGLLPGSPSGETCLATATGVLGAPRPGRATLRPAALPAGRRFRNRSGQSRRKSPPSCWRPPACRATTRQPERANGQRLLLQDHRPGHWTHRTAGTSANGSTAPARLTSLSCRQVESEKWKPTFPDQPPGTSWSFATSLRCADGRSISEVIAAGISFDVGPLSSLPPLNHHEILCCGQGVGVGPQVQMCRPDAHPIPPLKGEGNPAARHRSWP